MDLILVRINSAKLHCWKPLEDELSESLAQYQHTDILSVLSIMAQLPCVQLPASLTKHLTFKVWFILSYVKERAVAVGNTSIARNRHSQIPVSLVLN